MKNRKPEILKQVEPIRTLLEREKWKRERYATGKHAARRIDEANRMIERLEKIEQWIRSRITEDEWKGMLG